MYAPSCSSRVNSLTVEINSARVGAFLLVGLLPFCFMRDVFSMRRATRRGGVGGLTRGGIFGMVCRCATAGDVAQLVERLVRNEEVRGSNPLISTSFLEP